MGQPRQAESWWEFLHMNLSENEIKAAIVVATLLTLSLIGWIPNFLENHPRWRLRNVLRKAKRGTTAIWKTKRELNKEELSAFLFQAAALGCRADITNGTITGMVITVIPPYRWLCPEIEAQYDETIKAEMERIPTRRRSLKRNSRELSRLLKSSPGERFDATKRELEISDLKGWITDLTNKLLNRGDEWQKELRQRIRVDKITFATTTLLTQGQEVQGSPQWKKDRILFRLGYRYYVLVLASGREISIDTTNGPSVGLNLNITDVLCDITRFNSDERELVRKDIERIQEERKAA